TPAGILRAIRHEAVAGLLLGTASAVIVALVALIWLGQSSVAAAVLGGIAGGMATAAVVGAAMPNLVRLFAREPQVAAGPVALAATDMATLAIYFSLARYLLG
ncbi:MAG: magnesium transporter, partial [Planctomycetes bacterium]|nr:magnesium transporter [Planctomycetota bacterium]